VTCNVADDKGQTAASTATVTVESPVAAPKPMTSALCPISFERNPRRPARVDNEAKACLDGVALTLQRDSGATLVLVGNAASGENVARNSPLSAQRTQRPILSAKRESIPPGLPCTQALKTERSSRPPWFRQMQRSMPRATLS